MKGQWVDEIHVTIICNITLYVILFAVFYFLCSLLFRGNIYSVYTVDPVYSERGYSEYPVIVNGFLRTDR
jgi:hypothetical protein